MKEDLINQLINFKKELQELKSKLSSMPGECVSRKEYRAKAEYIANLWVENLRSPLEHQIKLPNEVIKDTAEHMKHLYVLSRPNNLKKSYIDTINSVLKKFDDKFILPIQQTALKIDTVIDLRKLLPAIIDPHESGYLLESIECAASGYKRAAIVMGWCATIDHIQKKIMVIGLDKFNKTSKKLKESASSKYKKWNKEFSISTLAELQAIFDTDLIVMIEAMELIDSNQAERLRIAFQYRNHSAHPGSAPIEDPHLVVFFTDITAIILQNPTFTI